MANMKQDRNIATPPRWADRFFEWYCNDDLQEELQGDLYERFHEKVETSGARWARVWYWLNVFLFINKYTLRRNPHPYAQTNHLDMFQNYFKTGFRNITNNGLSTFINATGLAMAIGCCLVVFTFVDWSFNTDSHHKNRDEVYVVQRLIDQDGDISKWGNSPEPIGPAIMDDFPQVINTVRLKHESGIFKKGEKVFSERVTFVDDAFYELFDFAVKYGQIEHFTDPDGIVLTENAAKRYFGEKNPIGELINIRFRVADKEMTEEFTVKGVMERPPLGSSFIFNSLIPYQRQSILGKQDLNDWSKTANITFLHIPNPADVPAVKKSEDKYIALANAANKNRKVTGLILQPLKHITMHSFDVNYSMFFTTHIAGFIMLGMIAVSLLTLVCFNYMNIAIASASTRLKEISVRKVIGGTRKQIIMQFLSENLIVCGLAILLGIFLAQTIFLPWFNEMGGVEFTFGILDNPRLWMVIFALVFISALGGAGYPALYVSKLQPVQIFKNKMKLGGKNRFRKVLLGVQFFLTFLTLFAAISFIIEAKEIREKSWGYKPNDLVNIDLELGGDYEQLRNELQLHRDVISVSGAAQPLGNWQEELTVNVKGQAYQMDGLTVDHDYPELMGLEIKSGRSFDADRELDKTASILVNEAFRKRMGWENAVGQSVEIFDQTYHIVGELRNFHFETFEYTIKPMVLRVGIPSDFKFVVVRTSAGAMTDVAKNIEPIWKKLHPDLPFDYFFQDAVFDHYFRAFTQVTKILNATSLLTIIISSMGLFGLAMLLLSRRMKEVSVRKVLGAGLVGLSWHINREFFITIVIASVLAAPVGWFLMSTLLGQVTLETSFGPLPFVLAVLALVVMTLVSISKHIYQMATSNPTRFLRDE